MNEYMFGTSYDRITRKEAKRREQIAKKHGVWFTEINVKQGSCPGINNGRYQSWFSGPNRGWPFDDQLRERVLSEIGILQA